MTNKRSIRYVSFMLTITCLIGMLALPAFAWEDMGPFSYWYSDSGDIGYHTVSTKKVLQGTTGAGFGSAITTYATAARGAWSSEGPFSTTTNSDFQIQFSDATRSEANSLGVPSNVDALTDTGSRTFVGYASYGSSRKNVYSISRAYVYLIYDNRTSQFSSSKWKAIAAHEFGHALGYFGHDVNSTASQKSLMNPYTNVYWDEWSVSTPTTRDKNHLGNI